MRRAFSALPRLSHVLSGFAILLALLAGCKGMTKALSNRLTKWQMLDQKTALDDPLRAVGGHGTVFAPGLAEQPLSREQLAQAQPPQLVAYYAPIFVQQRQNPAVQDPPYPPQYDDIGEAQLVRDARAKYKAVVAGQPRVYAIYQKRQIGGQPHVQLTYTAWYPAHPRMKLIDLEEADIDSCVVRVTLDASNAPLFYETIAACGCFHKVFVEKHIEDGARTTYGAPLAGKKLSVEQKLDQDIDWEVAGVVDQPAQEPRRPVVFLKAGDHKVIGMGSAGRLRPPNPAFVRRYALADYAELYSVPVAGTQERAPFFNTGDGGKVWGAERREGRLLSLIGVDAAGQPRANDQIKLHFDQSTWDDVSTYQRYLRLPAGTL